MKAIVYREYGTPGVLRCEETAKPAPGDHARLEPVIDRCYPLSVAAEAFRYLDSKQARGKVVIALEQHGQD